MSDLLFADDTSASRFTLHRGDELVSVLDYRDDGRTIALTRAFTIPTHRGHGYAAIVTERAVDAIEAAGDREIIPVCWYVGEWFDAHPERAGLLHRRPASRAEARCAGPLHHHPASRAATRRAPGRSSTPASRSGGGTKLETSKGGVMNDDRDLPEGVIDADPPGGWESGAIADGETAERNEHAKGSSRLNDAEPSDPIEGDAASQGIDPDLSTED